MKPDDFDLLQPYISLFEIAHHIPGRIRLKLNGINAGVRQAAAHAKRFHDTLRSIPGIQSVRLNLVARSCTVEYDQELIPFRAWPDLLAGTRSVDALKLLDILRKKLDSLPRA